MAARDGAIEAQRGPVSHSWLNPSIGHIQHYCLVHSFHYFQPRLLLFGTLYHQNGKAGTTHRQNADETLLPANRDVKQLQVFPTLWLLCQSEGWDQRWQVERGGGRDLSFFLFLVTDNQRVWALRLWAPTPIDAIKLPAWRRTVHEQSVRGWWGCIVWLVCEDKRGNRVFISFTAAGINWCKRIVFGLSSSVTSTVTMFTVMYKCPFGVIYPGTLADSAIAKAWPLFSNVIAMWIFILLVWLACEELPKEDEWAEKL